MPSESEMTQMRGQGHEAAGQTMIDVAMALMREVKTDISKLSDKMDKIAEERREEAREHGGLEVRVANPETSHNSVKKVSYSVAAALIIALVLWPIRMAALHPDTLPK